VSTTETPTFAPAGSWRLDPVHSSVGFEIAYLAGTFKGEFREVEAALAFEGAGVRLSGAAKVASVDVKDENLAAHLQSPDFFDAERHPELRFEAEDISLDGDSVTVSGEITIRGVTRPVVLSGTLSAVMADPYGTERFGVTLAATVDRTEFGLDWNTPLPSGGPALADTVTIAAELQFVRAD
jgi:polyisoprenoid-binding protein YceI